MSDQSAIVPLKEYVRSPEIMERFADVVGKGNAGAYVQSVILAAAMNDSLQRCEPKSIVASALRAAALRLSCDPSTGHAYLIPFKGRATLVVGYKGLINLAERTGKYRYINAGPIFEGEEYVEDRITGLAKIEGAKTSNKTIGYVASFQLLTGFSKTIYMTIEEIHEHARKYSKSYTLSDSTWKTNTKDMERKTVLRRLISQWGYMDPNDAMMVNPEASDDVIDGEIYDEVYNLPQPDEVTPVEKPPAPSYEEVFGQPEPKAKPAPNGHEPEPEPTPAVVYTGAPGTLAKFGKHNYPKGWVKALMTGAGFSDDIFHIDGILQKLALPQDTAPEKVIDAIEDYIAGKK